MNTFFKMEWQQLLNSGLLMACGNVDQAWPNLEFFFKPSFLFGNQLKTQQDLRWTNMPED
jgi:hypothetical protein